MKSFTHFLTERYLNLFVDTDKEKYAQTVYDLLQSSYSSIGGIKGSGFNSVQDMIKNIPFWKIVKRGDKIVAGAMYKDKGGRKRVAVFTDGSADGKKELAGIYKDEFKRAFFEVSEGSLGFIVKTVGVDFVKLYAKTPKEVEKILDEPIAEVPSDDVHLQKLPQLKDFFYQREIGGKLKTKILLGTAGKTIDTF